MTSATLDKIQTLEIGISIVNVIFNMVKTLLIVICVLIIFSLLMLSIDSKTFETTVIRTLGLQKSGVVALVMF